MTKEQLKKKLKDISNRITEMENEYNIFTVKQREKLRKAKDQREVDSIMYDLTKKQISINKGIVFAKGEFYKYSQQFKNAK